MQDDKFKPHIRQLIVAEQIARSGFMNNRKKVDPSIPGSCKTGGALLAIKSINYYLKGSKRVKTLFLSPGHLIPKMQDEARLFLGDETKLVAITQERREYDIDRAAQNADIVFLSYEMSFRNIRTSYDSQEIASQALADLFKARTEFSSLEDAVNELTRLIGKNKTDRILLKSQNIVDITAEIVKARYRKNEMSVIESLSQRIFPDDGLYYVIVDEVHNLVSDESKTALAIGDFFRKAKWGVALTGTMVGNFIDNDAYLAYLLGIIDNLQDYKRIVGNDPMKVKAVFKPYTLFPVITELRQIDPYVPEPEHITLKYSPSIENVQLHVELENAKCFSGGEKILISRYLLTAPQKLHPNYISEIEKEGSMLDRVSSFFSESEDRMSLLEKLIENVPDRVKKLVDYVKGTKPEDKVLIFVEYTTTTSKFLKDELRKNGFNFELIDQTVSVKLDEKGMSERMLRWKNSQLDNSIKGLIGSRTCREGLDGQSFTHIIHYEGKTVHSTEDQQNARAVRAGQRKKVNICKLTADGILTDEIIESVCNAKREIMHAYYTREPTPEDIEKMIIKMSDEKASKLSHLRQIDSRGHLGIFFSAHVGIGSKGFHQALSSYANHLFMVERFNRNYEASHSANVGRLLNELIYKNDENKKTLGLELNLQKRILVADLGSGCSVYSRATGRPSICVDISRFQLEHGELACDGKVNGNRYMLGSMHDLSNLVDIANTDDILFDTEKNYERREKIEENSLDLIICSNAFYFLNQHERRLFFDSVKRTLKDNRYIILAIPKSKISANCEAKFLHDIEEAGFEIDQNLSGHYVGLQGHDFETKERIQGTNFESLIISAKNIRNTQSRYNDRRNCFVLQDEYEVRDGTINQVDLDEGERVSKYPRVVCDRFYKSEELNTEYIENDVKNIDIVSDLVSIKENGQGDRFMEILKKISEAIESG